MSLFRPAKSVKPFVLSKTRRLWLWLLLRADRVRLPGPTVLPIAGAVVGIYCGLAAGLFARLISVLGALTIELPHLFETWSELPSRVMKAAVETDWNLEYAIVGLPLAGAAMAFVRLMPADEARALARTRLRILALLLLGALGLYYPLVALAAVSRGLGHTGGVRAALGQVPWAILPLLPALGGALVGRLLRDHPETHGHGVPEVVLSVRRAREGLQMRGGVLKLVASSVTIGTGGSAGREGPIVYSGAAFGAAVARTLGFSRRELALLMACGAGAGIAASFNAPMAGAVFAMEIILREFELRVFSPIILASVTATLVGRGVLEGETLFHGVQFRLTSGWEILAYVLLGVLCGLLAFLFVRMLHRTETFFAGKERFALSRWLGAKPLWFRAALGGLLSGLLIWLNPIAWGTGIAFLEPASMGQLGLSFLATGCLLKLIATSLTIGSGGSGGTFFPAVVIGGMAGGTVGELVHLLFQGAGPSGGYALVGMTGVVAGLTRGPLTSMMMLYELSQSLGIVLPAMTTASIASALCHWLLERRMPAVRTDNEVLQSTSVHTLVQEVTPVPGQTRVQPLLDMLLVAEEGALPVVDANGAIVGLVQVDRLRDVWRDEALHAVVVAADLARKVPLLEPQSDLMMALELMEQEDVDALPVSIPLPEGRSALLTRSAIRRRLQAERVRREGTHAHGAHAPVAVSELPRGSSLH